MVGDVNVERPTIRHSQPLANKDIVQLFASTGVEATRWLDGAVRREVPLHPLYLRIGRLGVKVTGHYGPAAVGMGDDDAKLRIADCLVTGSRTIMAGDF